MNLKTKAKILLGLFALSYTLGYCYPISVQAAMPPEETTNVTIPPLTAENLGAELNSALVNFERTNNRIQIDTITDTIRNRHIELNRNKKYELITEIISWGGCYLTRHAALNMVPNLEINERLIATTIQLIDICNNLLRFFLELDNTYIEIDDHNEIGNTLLHSAVIHHNPHAVNILLEHGARADVMNIYHQTPYALAMLLNTRFRLATNAYPSTLDIFRSHGIIQ